MQIIKDDDIKRRFCINKIYKKYSILYYIKVIDFDNNND